MTTKVTRATYPAPIPRTSLIGGDLEEPLKLSFAAGTLEGFLASYDEIAADGTSRRIISVAFSVPLSPEEYGQLATICAAALERGGVVPPGATWSLAETP